MSLTAYPTPTLVGLGGEQGDTDGFWTPEIWTGMLVSIELHDQCIQWIQRVCGRDGCGVEQRQEERGRGRAGQGEKWSREGRGGEEERGGVSLGQKERSVF